eukprot:8244668-Pyramimonas_sp.AAC.1
MEVKQSWRPSPLYRTMRKSMNMPTPIQRRNTSTSLMDTTRNDAGHPGQYFLAKPTEANGAAAHQLLPGAQA